MDKELDFQIKNLLESNENLELPEKISKGIDEVLTKIDNKQKRKRWIKGGLIAASLFFTVMVGLGTTFPALAQQMPIVNKILGKESLFSKGFQNDKFFKNIRNVQNNSVSIEQTATDKGISITMKEIAYDGTALYVVYQVKGNIPVDKLRNLGTISIDGKSHDFISGRLIAMQKLDNKTIQAVQMFPISGEDKLADKFDVSIKFTEVQWKSGNWQFNMKLDKKELAKNSKYTNLNKEVQFNSGKAVVRSLVQSATFATLTIDYDNYNEGRDLNAFSLIDDTGTELQQTWLSKETNKGEKTEVVAVYNVSKNTKIKKVVADQSNPQYAYPEKLKNAIYVKYNDIFPKTVSVGSGKEITINSIGIEEYGVLDNINKYYVLNISAKDLSMQDYVLRGGITVYHKNMDKKNYNAYDFANAYVEGKNTYEIRYLGDVTKVQTSNQVLAFAPYDDVLQEVAEINIK